MCEPVGRVSDEGGFGRARREPRAARKPVREKPTEVGGANTSSNGNETIANKGRIDDTAYPRCGEGCGDTLLRWIFIKMSSNFVQKTPPF